MLHKKNKISGINESQFDFKNSDDEEEQNSKLGRVSREQENLHEQPTAKSSLSSFSKDLIRKSENPRKIKDSKESTNIPSENTIHVTKPRTTSNINERKKMLETNSTFNIIAIAYFIQCLTRLLLEIGFAYLQSQLFVFDVPELYKCRRWPCPKTVT